MNSVIIISNLIQGCIWLYCALLLLMIKTIPHPFNKSYRKAKRYLAFLFITIFGTYVISFTNGELSVVKLEIFGIYNIISLYIINIFVFLSLHCLINDNKGVNLKLFITRIPFVVLFLAYCSLSISHGATQVYSMGEYIDKILTSPTLILKTLMLILVAIQFKLNINIYIKRYKSYIDSLYNYFLGKAQVLQKLIRQMIIFTNFIAVISIVSVMVSSEVYDVIYSIILSVASIYYTAKFSNYQSYFHSLISSNRFINIAQKKYDDKPLNNWEIIIQQEEEIEELLSMWVNRDDKPFLKCSITLREVSQMTGITERKLSKHINNQYGMTFNSWINGLKVEEVKLLLKHKKSNITLTEIAYQSGFVDLSSMSNTFKKITGISPSKFTK